METVNPKNFVDIDPLLVSFITLKDGNMIMIDETVPAKPNKVRLFQEEEKNNFDPKKKKKNRSQELSLSKQSNLNFIGNQQKMKPITIIKKSDFNSISSISKNISFSFMKDGIKNANLPSPNCSVDIKSSMFQTRRDNNNINYNNTNMNTINNNILSEDNVNIHMIDTTMSKQMNCNSNNENKDKIVPANIFKSNLIDNNYKLKSKNNENEDNKNNYDYNYNNNNNYIKKDNLNDNIDEKEEQNDLNLNNNNDNLNNLNNLNNFTETNNKNEKASFINKPSLVMQNKNLYSQNNYRSNNINANEPIKKNLTEINMNDTSSREKKRNSINRYSKVNNRLSKSGKDNNYVKAVVSLNIPAEDQEEINLVKQFNSLVDRLNGQKSHQQTRINLKKSDKYYELYKNSNENNILNSILSPGRNKKKFAHNNYIIDSNNNYSNSKFIDNNLSNYFSNDVSMISYGRNNNLNSRILALREKTYTSINNSFRNDSKDNFSSSINSEIVLPSNFAFRK